MTKRVIVMDHQCIVPDFNSIENMSTELVLLKNLLQNKICLLTDNMFLINN